MKPTVSTPRNDHHRPEGVDRLGVRHLQQAHRPGEQERHLEVEDDEQDRDQVEAHVELHPRVVEGVEAALVGGELLRVGRLGRDDASAAMMKAMPSAAAMARKITIGRYCSRNAFIGARIRNGRRRRGVARSSSPWSAAVQTRLGESLRRLRLHGKALARPAPTRQSAVRHAACARSAFRGEAMKTTILAAALAAATLGLARRRCPVRDRSTRASTGAVTHCCSPPRCVRTAASRAAASPSATGPRLRWRCRAGSALRPVRSAYAARPQLLRHLLHLTRADLRPAGQARALTS